MKIPTRVKRITSLFRIRKLRVIATFSVLLIGLVIATLVTPFKGSDGQEMFYDGTENSVPQATYMRAKVIAKENASLTENATLRVRLLDGSRSGQEATVKWTSNAATSKTISEGTVVIVGVYSNSKNDVSFVGNFRIPALIMMTTVFIMLVLMVGGRHGAMSLIGLTVGILVISWFIVPLILDGHNAFWVCIAGSYIIAVTSIFIAHGTGRRTKIALLCISVILGLVCLLSYLAVVFAGLSGLTDEVSWYLYRGLSGLDMQGIVAGGIIIATLGVLDDIVTAQVAVVEELKKANPKISLGKLYTAGTSVGREHIASLVNTLALAYAGASLPLILQVVRNNIDSMAVLFSMEDIATEIVRTLVASSGLVLAVPVSTLVAAVIYTRFTVQKHT